MSSLLYFSSLTDCCSFPIQTKKDDWKRRVGQLEKDHSKEYKKSRVALKKRVEAVGRLDKKLRKGKKPDRDLERLRDGMARELLLRREEILEQERAAVRAIAHQERTHFTTFAACVKPLVSQEVAMLREVEQLEGVMERVDRIILQPFKDLESSEDILSLVAECSGSSLLASSQYSSPGGSTLGSRSGSLRSLDFTPRAREPAHSQVTPAASASISVSISQS